MDVKQEIARVKKVPQLVTLESSLKTDPLLVLFAKTKFKSNITL